MRDVTSPSSSRFGNCQSPKSSSNASDEKLNDALSNKFTRNGLPEDNTFMKEENKIHNITYGNCITLILYLLMINLIRITMYAL